jgi:RND family efflux transporter MFP subunit
MQRPEGDGRRPGALGRVLGLTFIVVIVLAALAAWGISARTATMVSLRQETDDAAIPTVAVIQPKAGAPHEEIVLPGNVQAYTDAPIYARTSGYLRHRYVDLGSRVKAGQLLAEIDAPELEDQLRQTRADLATAEANARLARITADRYAELRKSDSVSQQDADNAAGSLDARTSAVTSAQSNVQRLEKLHAYTKIYAPFDGVITARNTDVGALIDSGAGGGAARELFHIASTDRLRVFVNVPEVHAQAVHEGLVAELRLTQLPGRTFKGTLAHTARAIDVASRTMLVELDVPNPSGELLAGSYAEAHIKLPSGASTYRLPVNTLMFRSDGLKVGLVKDGNRVAMASIAVGRDFGSEVEVLSGVSADDKVILDPPDSLEEGQIVRIARQAPVKREGQPQ